MKRQNLRTVSLIVATFTYLLLGAAIFGYLESDHELKQREYLELIELIVKRKYNISEDDFTVLTTTVIKSVPHKAGIQWKFPGAFYFATTVVTTIGYGHSTPATMAGRSFCMIYALIGIPLGLVMFQSIGERLNTFVGSFLKYAKQCFKAKNREVTQTNLVMVVSVLSTILMTSMAAIFAKYERWDYFDALYYCFITLTTIGFGDYVALQKESALQSKPEYVCLSLIFILFGLSVVSSAVNLLVLKFLTLNTEDEKRDEQLRYSAALDPIQLEGDVITSASGKLEYARDMKLRSSTSSIQEQQQHHRHHHHHHHQKTTSDNDDCFDDTVAISSPAHCSNNSQHDNFNIYQQQHNNSSNMNDCFSVRQKTIGIGNNSIGAPDNDSNFNIGEAPMLMMSRLPSSRHKDWCHSSHCANLELPCIVGRPLSASASCQQHQLVDGQPRKLRNAASTTDRFYGDNTNTSIDHQDTQRSQWPSNENHSISVSEPKDSSSISQSEGRDEEADKQMMVAPIDSSSDENNGSIFTVSSPKHLDDDCCHISDIYCRAHCPNHLLHHHHLHHHHCHHSHQQDSLLHRRLHHHHHLHPMPNDERHDGPRANLELIRHVGVRRKLHSSGRKREVASGQDTRSSAGTNNGTSSCSGQSRRSRSMEISSRL